LFYLQEDNKFKRTMLKTQALFITSIITFFFLRVTAQENWFPLNINESSAKVEFDLTDWLHRPAGKHGCVLTDGDRKVLKGDWPLEAMAVGKTVITFTKEKPARNMAGLAPFIKGTQVYSNTGQLMWDKTGYFTVNSPGTQGVVGFAEKTKHGLEDISIKTSNPFAVILATSLDPESGIKKTDRILITTIARAKNSGMIYNEDHSELLEVGEAPLLLEPVKAVFEFKRKEKITVSVLDHLGRKTGQTIRPKGKKLVLDGAETKAFYYLVEYTNL